MNDFFQNLQAWWPVLRGGLLITLRVSFIAMPTAMAIGLVIALIRSGQSLVARTLKPFAVVYVEVLRGLPLILILFILYFALPAFGVVISRNAIVVGTIGLSMNLGAYLSEVFRAALGAVDPGQGEAALSLGMSPTRTYTRVILPQALRVAVPTLGGYFISLLKDSSLLGFIGVEELFRTGVDLVAVNFRAGQVYVIVGGIYLILSLVSAFIIRLLERALTPDRAKTRRGGPRPDILTTDPMAVRP